MMGDFLARHIQKLVEIVQNYWQEFTFWVSEWWQAAQFLALDVISQSLNAVSGLVTGNDINFTGINFYLANMNHFAPIEEIFAGLTALGSYAVTIWVIRVTIKIIPTVG